MNKSKFMKALVGIMASAVTITAVSVSAFALNNLNVRDNGDGTVTVTANDIDKIEKEINELKRFISKGASQ